MQNSEIRDKIFKGLKNVFNYYVDANLESGHYIKPEYLLTVKIAESLCENNTEFKIKLEEPTADFANSCVKNFSNNSFNFINNNTERNGRIDIAVYSNQNERDYYPYKSIFPIEIKNINPYKYEIILDVFRNLEFFKMKNSNGDKSVVKKAYNISIEETKDIYKEDLKEETKKCKEKYEQWLSESGLITNDIEFEVFTENLEEPTISNQDKFSPEEGLTESDYTGNYCRIGIIIELRAK